MYTAGVDYAMSTALMFTETISAGSRSSSFDVDIFNDMIHEDNETFNIAIRLLSSCSSLSLDISSSTVTIIDNDELVIRVRFTQEQFTGSEAMGFVMVNLELIGGSSANSFNVTVTPLEQSPASAEGNNVICVLLCVEWSVFD